MSTIRCVYHPVNGQAKDPGFPATDQHPNAVRYAIGQYLVDALGGQPSQAELDAHIAGARGADLPGFYADLKALAGSAVALNTVIGKNYPTLMLDIQQGNWADASSLIADAKAKGVISAGQYTQIQGFAAARDIPLALP